jgi:uncharacterized membrane protein HdeD (DUF308 family)
MSEYAPSRTEEPSDHRADSLSVLYVIGAALLCGVGLFITLFGVILWSGGYSDWVYWLGVLPLLAGFWMLMRPRAGDQGPD